jgi:hypothetical protein
MFVPLGKLQSIFCIFAIPLSNEKKNGHKKMDNKSICLPQRKRQRIEALSKGSRKSVKGSLQQNSRPTSLPNLLKFTSTREIEWEKYSERERKGGRERERVRKRS